MIKATSAPKMLKYPFLIELVVDNEEIISLNSDNVEMKISQKINNEMIELLKITNRSDGDNNVIDIALNREARKFLRVIRGKE